MVAMVRVEVAVPPAVGVTLGDEKVHVEFLGRSPHVRLVAALKPFTEATVTVTTAFVPALKEPFAGSSVRVKAGAPAYTVSATAGDVDAALSVSPP